VAIQEVAVPDIGSTDPVDVIEVSVAVGDTVAAEDTLLVLESDKATVEVPSPVSGVVTEIRVKTGDAVKEGDLLFLMDAGEAVSEAAAPGAVEEEVPSATSPEPVEEADPGQVEVPAAAEKITVSVPDIGDAEGVEVIEVNIAVGDHLNKEDTMVVLESDKASIEVPCPRDGTVEKILVSTGDKVSRGTPVIELLVQSGQSLPAAPSAKSSAPSSPGSSEPQTGEAAKPVTAPASAPESSGVKSSARVYAGPAVRKLARKLGVDLAGVSATGPRSRILKEDVFNFVNTRLSGIGKGELSGAGSGLPALPEIDFARFGEIEEQPLTRINKLSASNLHRAWVHIPHVTQFDDADITELESFRKAEGAKLKERGIKLTFMAFLIKASARALQEFPRFNASLDNSGETLILKKYINIGIAVDTPNGLVVPVITDADRKSVVDLAIELGELSQKARDKKLSPKDMQGGCFSISSLGGIGGTAFTPIVNWPEVSILGVSRSRLQPVYLGGEFQPRLMLPLSLSYDHRVIDGADAARFTTYLSQLLGDIRRLVL